MIRLSARGVDAIVDVATGVPVLAYWGRALGDINLDSLALASQRPITGGALDVVAPIGFLPEHGSGFPGRPGLLGHRQGGRSWAPRFQIESIQQPSDQTVNITMVDAVAQLSATINVALDHLLTVRVTLTNVGTTRYLLDQLMVSIPLPDHAEELLWFTGRWTREFHQVRSPFTHGAFAAETRGGRSSHDHVPTVFAGDRRFGEWSGEVWGLHLGWSGNHHMLAEVLPDGRKLVQYGELLHPGEVVLEAGATYVAPTMYCSYSPAGLNQASWGFHRHLRSRPSHPQRPRPTLINTWEAVYFDHDLDRLKALADTAAQVGVERYVLDDGWFGSRRNDRSGLGDWTVSADAHPNGLAPLIDHVVGLGMEFGIWVEPEMVNPDSDLFRKHPDWALVTDGYEPVMGRQQLVLNLGHPDAYAHILGQLDALLSDHDVAFVKWDMNRFHVQGSGVDGAAGSHAQTVALHRLLDELRGRHPTVEIESCSSGGGRVDFEILEHTDRVWTSDCNDALERQYIQRGVSTFLPPELMGAHIGPTVAHTTGRSHTLAFRAITALVGHLGIEWNLLTLSDTERQQLAAYVALHKRFRQLLHSGDVVRFDPICNGPTESGHAYGVYATDRGQALVVAAQLTSGMSLTPPALRLPGLDSDASYEIHLLDPPGVRSHVARQQPAWASDGITLTGAQLGAHGLHLPSMDPETALLIHLIRLPTSP